MATQYLVTMKPDFLAEVNKLPMKEAQQIYNKVHLLSQDPAPDAKVKKQLKYMHGGRKLHRIRSGDYRVFYTFDQQYISILALRKRDEDTYEDALDEEFLGGLPIDPTETQNGNISRFKKPDWESLLLPQAEFRPLPEPITVELLNMLKVPVAYHKRLVLIKDQGALLSCPGVEDEILLRIDQHMFETPMIDVVRQPDLILYQVDDLLRYREGELLGFLLKLSPEQEKCVDWASSQSGPTLVKGGPGTGKSTVALYRVRSILKKLREEGKNNPRILFTTYTNALVNFSKQLLEQLLGSDICYVTIQTADHMMSSVIGRKRKDIIEDTEMQQFLKEALKQIRFEGNLVQQQAQRHILEKLGQDYLIQEINSVIVARQLQSLQEYLDIARHGRKIRLNHVHRKVIWSVYKLLQALIESSGKETWQQRHVRAAELVDTSSEYHSYDAVIIDEAQDLDLSALRFLVKLCREPRQIFVTADANQSIYGSSFNWSDVHECLNFRRRTSILQTNYRSTKEITEAALSYLTVDSMLDVDIGERDYINEGPFPDVRTVNNHQQEVALLEHFFRTATRILRLPLGSCALLCPGESIGRSFAQKLTECGLEATFMKGQDLNLKQPGVKILTLSSSKGLEFPIVALAGFIGSNYSIVPAEVSEEERDEILTKNRRTLFVGMTRAMRSLLVVMPENAESPLMRGFNPEYWNPGKYM